MMQVAENKLATSERDKLFDAFFNSEIGEQFRKQFTDSAAAIRARAKSALEDELKHRVAVLDKMGASARDAADKLKSAKATYEAAEIESRKLSDTYRNRRDDFAQRIAAIKSLANASAAYLEAEGINTLQELERRLGLKEAAPRSL